MSDEKCGITIEISMDYILWMLDNPNELNDDEMLWVKTFTDLMFEAAKE